MDGSVEAWLDALGHRDLPTETAEFIAARLGYRRQLWDELSLHDATELSRGGRIARLSLIHSIESDLDDLRRRATTTGLPDDGTGSQTYWKYPVGPGWSRHEQLGELRFPRAGFDDLSLQHRIYFGAPPNWPRSLIWSFVGCKYQGDTGWRSRQDLQILTATNSLRRHLQANGYYPHTPGRG